MSLTTSQVSRPTDSDQFIRDHQVAVWRYLRYLGCPSEHLEDVLQETFLIALQKPARTGAVGAYLRGIARNQWLKLRSRRELPRGDVDPDDVWNELARDDDDFIESLRRCFDELAARPRTGLELRFRDGLSRAEIGQRLSMSEQGVKTLLRRARERLRDCVLRRIR